MNANTVTTKWLNGAGSLRAASLWALGLLLICPRVLSGQEYGLDWFTIGGGGGTSTGGVYSVSGTIGQSDAGGAMSVGNYSLTGGFWSLLGTVPSPGAPAVSIQLSGNLVMVYWPSTATGFNPEVSTSLATPNWGTPPEKVQDNGTIKYLLINPAPGSRFYRLKR